MTHIVLAILALALAGMADAGQRVGVCHEYGCLVQEEVDYTDGQLAEIGRLLAAARGAAEERALLAQAIGRLYAWAGEQTAIRHDKGGNRADGNTPGRMDCIDHSTTTTRFLQLLEARGDLRWHRVKKPAVRRFALVFPAHYSAVIETTGEAPERFAVDSWFVDNGQPAVILPLRDWKKGAGPDV